MQVAQSLLAGADAFGPTEQGRGKESPLNAPLFMRNAEGIRAQPQAERGIAVELIGPCLALAPSGLHGNRNQRQEKDSGSRYYPEIAPFSPQFGEKTFYSSHTMMEAPKQCGLIASSEARIVDPGPASNRLLRETQSAARRLPEDRKTKQTDKREKVRDERFGRSAMSPATTGGWIANFVDRVL